MKSSDIRREENYSEYLRLLQDDDYVDVTYDEESGGMSAVHKLHKFGKQRGYGGMCRGDYERNVVSVLKKKGHRIVLGEETNTPGVKSFDGYLDDTPWKSKQLRVVGTGPSAQNYVTQRSNTLNVLCFSFLISHCIPVKEL